MHVIRLKVSAEDLKVFGIVKKAEDRIYRREARFIKMNNALTYFI